MNARHACLNCGAKLEGAYCKESGQKASTHRFSLLHFLQHDLVHGLFHLDKGVLHTLKELIYRPGAGAREFIAGKRVNHYSIFAFFIIVVALRHFLSKNDFTHGYFISDDKTTDDLLNHVVINYYKYLYLLAIPLLSCITWPFFWRLKYNFTEHLILNAFMLSAVLLYSLVFMLLGYLVSDWWFRKGMMTIILFYTVWNYYQAVKSAYSFWNYFWRICCVIILFFIALLLGFMGTIILMYGYDAMGNVHINRLF